MDGILELIPAARVGFVGLYRDPETLQPVQYYCKVPKELDARMTIVVDPMLATGNSSVAAIDVLKAEGAKNLRFLCLLASPEGWPGCAGTSRRTDRDRRAGRKAERSRLYRARPWGCRGPHVRHEMSRR